MLWIYILFGALLLGIIMVLGYLNDICKSLDEIQYYTRSMNAGVSNILENTKQLLYKIDCKDEE